MKRKPYLRLVVVAIATLVMAVSAGLPALAAKPQAPQQGRAIPVQSTVVQYIRVRVNLFVRAGPGMGYRVLDRLLAGNRVPVTGLSVDGRWWRVLCPPYGALGNCFVSANRAYSRPDLPNNPYEQLPVVYTDVTGVLMLENMNVRRGPALGYPRITTLRAGTVAAVTGVSLDGHYWRITCPPRGIVGNCFVSNNPDWTQPTD